MMSINTAAAAAHHARQLSNKLQPVGRRHALNDTPNRHDPKSRAALLTRDRMRCHAPAMSTTNTATARPAPRLAPAVSSTVWIYPSQKAAGMAAAREMGITWGEFVRRAIDEHIEKQEGATS